MSGKKEYPPPSVACLGDFKGLKGFCRGSYGSGVYSKRGGKWEVTAIASWSLDCGGSIGFYTNTQNFVGWITEVSKVKSDLNEVKATWGATEATAPVEVSTVTTVANATT